MVKAVALDHVVLRVADIERSFAWYGRLGLDGVRVEEWRKGKAPFPSLRITADSIIDLIETPRDGTNMDHFCFVVSAANLADIGRSGEFQVAGPAGRRYGARGWGQALYVNDPDGNTVELRSYEDADRHF